MQLRRFRAPRMAEAMAEVRAALGGEAVILDTRRVAGGVEVTAAAAREEPADWSELLLIPPEPAPASAPGWQARHGVPAGLAAALVGGPLAGRLAAGFGFAPLPDPAVRPVLLVGPPGAGKTLTCAKLAARLVMAGGAPMVITTDGARAGAAEQLAAFTRVLGLTLAVAPAAPLLAQAMAMRRPGQPVLIDTAGCNPFDPAEARALAGLIRASAGEPLLVLPAGLDPGEAAEIAAAFAALGARHLLPTRLDIARRLGGVLAAAAAGLAFTEAGTGPGVADGLTPLDPSFIARRLGGAEALA